MFPHIADIRVQCLRGFLTFILAFTSTPAVSQQWRKLDIPLIGSETVINSILHTSLDTAYYAGSNNIFLSSKNRGAKWEWIDPSLKCDICVAHFFELEYLGGAIYVSVQYASPFQTRFRLRSTDGGVTWDSISSEVKTGPITDALITRQVNNYLTDSLWIAVVSESSDTLSYKLSLHISTDRGGSWIKRSSIGSHTSGYFGQPPRDALEQFVAVTDSIFLVQVRDVVKGGLFCRSWDQGRTWQSWRDTLNVWTTYKIEPNLVLGFDGTYDRSSDYGGTWALPVSSSFPGWTDYAGLRINSNSTGEAYALVDRNDLARLLYHSSDYGEHWEVIDVAKGRWLEPPFFIDSIYAMGFTTDGIYTNVPLTASVKDRLFESSIAVVDGDLIVHEKMPLPNEIAVYDCIGRRFDLSETASGSGRYRILLPRGVYLIPRLGKFVW